ncbi:MAG: hypothetical protein QY312_01190 [Candidatus Dojkabacteria bacterium]|nr:MAG: hypothetical protein QY312_01190 [Candidatus Dojkabacteria bacterium]
MKRFPLFSLYIFLVAVALVFLAHIMILLPVLAPSLTFSFADLSALIGPKSGDLAFQKILFPYDSAGSSFSLEYFRYASLPGVLFLAASLLGATESWVWSVMTAIALSLGVFGFYKLFRQELQSPLGATAVAALLLFYFLNFYAVGRVIHIYIWFGYLVTPYLASLAFDYAKFGRKHSLIALALVFSQFFVFPHGLVYGALLIGLLSLFVARKSIKNAVSFLLSGALGYLVLNIQIFLSLLFPSSQYPIPANISMFELLSRNGSVENSLTFTNNWWYMTDMSDMQYYQAIAVVITIFAGVSLVVLLIRALLTKSWRDVWFLVALSVFAAIVLILGSGMNNEIVRAGVEWASSVGILGGFLVFREWARILLLLPILYVLVWSVSFSTFSEKSFVGLASRRFIPLIGVLFLVFSYFSFSLLWKSFSPVIFPRQYAELQTEIGEYSKVLWLSPTERPELYGLPRLSWDFGKTPDMVTKSIGNRYGNSSSVTLPMTNYLEKESHSRELAKDLLINHIIARYDIFGAQPPQITTRGTTFADNTSLLRKTALLEDGINARVQQTMYDVVEDPRVWDVLSENNFSFIPVDQPVQSTTRIRELSEVPYDMIVSDCRLQQSCQATVSSVYESLDRHLPEKIWSKGTTAQLVQEPFIYYLQEFEIPSYQTDKFRGTAFTYAEDATMEISLPLPERKGAYVALARVFFSPKSDELKFVFDTATTRVSTASVIPHFSWVRIGILSVDEVTQNISVSVQNKKGFAAVQEIVLIAEDEVDRLTQEIESDTIMLVSYAQESELHLPAGEFRILCRDAVVMVNQEQVSCLSTEELWVTTEDKIELQTGVVVFVPSAIQAKSDRSYISLTRHSPVRFTGGVQQYERGDVLLVSELYDPGWRASAQLSLGERVELESVRAYGFMQAFLLPEGNVTIEIDYLDATVIGYVRLFTLIAPLLLGGYWLVLYVNKDGSAFTKRR